MTIIEYLENNALMYADKLSLAEVSDDTIYHENSMTWQEFNINANRLSNWLIAHHITRDCKVAILIKNCINWLPIYFGILKTGAIAVPLNFNFDVSELQYCIELAECSVIIFSTEFLDKIKAIRASSSIRFICIEVGEHIWQSSEAYNSILESSSKFNPCIYIADEDNAAIYFSSGTTGFPKAILLTHKALMASAQTEQNHHQQSNSDNFLITAPLYHMGAKVHWFGNLVSGGSAVLLNTMSPYRIIEVISKKHITIAWLLLPCVQDILDAIDEGDVVLENYDLRSWRLTHMGAQPIPPEIMQRWIERFPAQQFDINYGLTEAGGPGCVHLGVDNIHKPGSIGKAGYKWEALIVSDEGTPVQNNVVGELIVKGDGIMVEYYKNSEETAKTIKNGWLFTGDMAYKDKDGFIYLVGRKKDLIISGGENIYPIQIENFLKTNSAIKDVAVIGVPNNRLGEIIVAIIEIKPGYQCSKAEMKKFCISLPPYRRPCKFIFAPILRNATGKIQKEKLREQYLLGSIWMKHHDDSEGLV